MKKSFYKKTLIIVSILGALFIALYIIDQTTPDNLVYENLYIAGKSPLKVTKLKLVDQQMNYLHSKIKTFKNLEHLDLGKNQLLQFRKEITQLSKLKTINLEYSNIKTLPKSMKNLSQLQKLNLAWNSLVQFPETITDLEQLTHLDLTANALTSIPEFIQKLNKTLKVLNLSYNPISQTNLKQVQQWLPNTKIIYKDNFSTVSDYKELYSSLNSNNFFSPFAHSPSFFSLRKKISKWSDKKGFYLNLNKAKSIKINCGDLNRFDLHYFKRLNRLQEVEIRNYINNEDLKNILAQFPNLEGIAFPLRKVPLSALEYLSTTQLKWVKLVVNIHQDSSSSSKIPDVFYTMPQIKILDLVPFPQYNYSAKNFKLPEIKKPIDALMLNNICWMPEDFGPLISIKILFAQNVENCRGIQKLKKLEFLDMSNPKNLDMVDLEFLKELSQLKELYLDNCKLKDINRYLTPHLKNLKQLKVLSIKNHLDENLDKKALQKALPNVKIIGW